jgi:glycine/D-amino acid oxidase-like deaminating enzyme
MRVAVVGAGILGASAAWWLVRGGAEVVVFDPAGAGGVATAGSFAWINASWGNDAAYRRLRMAAMADWGAWEVPGLGFRRSGGLIWDLPEPELRAFAVEARAQGYDLVEVDAAGARALEPGLAEVPGYALHAPGEGQVEPAAAARALLADARVVVRPAALRLQDAGGRVALAGRAGFDAVVLAAGVAVPGLLAGLGLSLPMTAPQGWLGWTDPLPPVLRGLVMTPALHLRQTAWGPLVLGADFTGAAGPDAVAGLVEAAGRLLGRADLRLVQTTAAARPTPADGHPAVGRLGPAGLWVMLSHSGVTLAPRLGRAVAAGVLGGAPDPLLAPYAPGRLAATARTAAS